MFYYIIDKDNFTINFFIKEYNGNSKKVISIYFNKLIEFIDLAKYNIDVYIHSDLLLNESKEMIFTEYFSSNFINLNYFIKDLKEEKNYDQLYN